MNSSNPAADLDLNQLGTDEAKAAAIQWLEQRGVGQRRVRIASATEPQAHMYGHACTLGLALCGVLNIVGPLTSTTR